MTIEKIPDDEMRDIDQLIALLRKKMTEDNPDLMLRDAHPKQHGLVKATFRVASQLPEALQQGVFQPGASYKAWVRFSNASGQLASDYKKDIRGAAIKLLDVAGEKLAVEGGNKTSQDFLFVSTPVFIARNVKDFTRLAKGLVGSKLRLLIFLFTHLRVLFNIIKSKDAIFSPLEARYWSTTPYQFGAAAVVKYSLQPRASATPLPKGLNADFLRTNMALQLAAKEYVFDFSVQLQTNLKAMPIEDASIEWPEALSPFIVVATLTIEQQVFDSPAQNNLGRLLSFNPWHALFAHRPLGGINRARRLIYPTLSKYRHEVNNDAVIEPIDYTVPPFNAF